MPQTVRCDERHDLEIKVNPAVQAMYTAKDEHRRAAMVAERNAVHALEAHISEHVGIPAKLNACSGWNPNGIPE